MADWARRVAGFFRWAETRPVLSGSSYAADAGLAVIVTIAAVVAASEGYLTVGRHRQVLGDGSSGKPPNNALHDLLGPAAQHAPLTHLAQIPSWALLGVVLATAPLAFRRTYPTSAFCVILAAVIATSHYSTAITVAIGDLRRVLRRRLQQVPPDGAAQPDSRGDRHHRWPIPKPPRRCQSVSLRS